MLLSVVGNKEPVCPLSPANHLLTNYPTPIVASKAFDKVNHWHLFDKLLNCGVPVYVVRMLLYWHTYQDFIVRWNNTLSPSFKVSNGVRQGGILSPRLFSIYIDDLSKALSKANIRLPFILSLY